MRIRSNTLMAGLALVLGLLATGPRSAAASPRFYKRHSVAAGTMNGGAWGHIVRKANMRNRNIRVQFDNGQNPLLEVPMDSAISRNGRKVSIHDLHNGDRVRVWARRGKTGEAMQAWRIQATGK